MKRRWVANGLPDYPMWIAALIDSAALVTAVVAVAAARRATDLLPAVGLAAGRAGAVGAELWGQAATWPAFVVLTGGSMRRR